MKKMTNIIVRSLSSQIRNGNIESHEKLDEKIDQAISELQFERQNLHDKLKSQLTCQHEEFNPATYTIQRRVIGYAIVYERVCKNCSKPERYTVGIDDDRNDIPDWAKSATEQYYNNSIF